MIKAIRKFISSRLYLSSLWHCASSTVRLKTLVGIFRNKFEHLTELGRSGYILP